MPRRFLRLTRAHTVPLEAVPAIVGAALATGTVWSLDVALWGAFGALYHLTGYGMNSYSDWKNGYDKEDEWKQHHPLNSGGISPEAAKLTVVSLLALTFAYIPLALNPSPGAVGVLVLGLASGVVYNELGKRIEGKFLFIAIAHTSVFVAPYLSLGGDIDRMFLFGAAYVFIWVTYQISVSGEVKDITTDEANFLKELGARTIDGAVIFPDVCLIYGYILKSLNIILAIGLILLGDQNMWSLFVVAILGALSLWLNEELLKTDIYCRMTRIENMSTIEMFTLVIFCISYTSTLGAQAVGAIILGSGVWVILGNRYIWGTWVAPRV